MAAVACIDALKLSAPLTSWRDARADIVNKFANSAWGRKLAKRVQKTQLTDFERYQATAAKRKASAGARKTLLKLKKEAGIA